MAALGTGRGKLLLFGEHAAVYGYPAVGVSLEAFTSAELQLDGRGGWDVEGVEPADREPVQRTLARLEQLTGREPRGGLVSLRSSVPRGLGFGSSAALCAALASALAVGCAQAPVPLQRIWAWAHEAERLFHGTPSGIDTGLALLGGLYSFQPRPPGLPEARRLRGLDLSLVAGAVPRRAGAGALIAGLRARVAAGEAAARQRLGRLGGIAAEAAQVLDGAAGGGAEHLGGLAVEAQETLAELGLSSPELEAVLAQGRRAGALGGKLSGAGGGGAFFLLFADAASAQEAAARLRGGVVTPLVLAPQGEGPAQGEGPSAGRSWRG